MDDERIEIALAADGGYFHGLLVTACSIAAYADKSVTLVFNILDGGISEVDWKMLKQEVSELHPSALFNPITVDEKLFMNYPTWNGNRMAYARLLLPDALLNTDWVLYCDCDFLWLRDVAELWKERDEKLCLIGTADLTPWAMQLERDWFAKNGFEFDEKKYFCSGLCLLNLRRFRCEGLIEKCNQIMSIPDINFPDQAALNIVTWGRTKLLPKSVWQCFTHEVTQTELDAGTVIHYAGELPWRFVRKLQVLSDTMLIWHRFNSMIRGVSLRQSLRSYFSVWQIVWHRALCWIFRLRLLRVVMQWIFRRANRLGAYDRFVIRARRLMVCFRGMGA